MHVLLKYYAQFIAYILLLLSLFLPVHLFYRCLFHSADVKTAIHVKEDIAWEDCSTTIRYKTGDRHHDMTPNYNYLIDGKYGLDILVFSGDDDDVCATIGTQDWIWGLGYTVAGKAWQTYTVNGQVGGYLTKWKNTKLAFATVHGYVCNHLFTAID